ncbi:MAG: hypothetical protein JWS10_3837 [Cypionkella sp.]|uniref:acyltransferase family protein n=1 Tax=Cypionkella sp. TaxID=2811411 RepID=UPI002622ACD8|nr:acyltransferase family protein [Cypionkella sp.]MDB5661222.1 hypothetical protein [Cypionkella sp.]
MAGSPRNGSIDLLRGLAAFGIVWFHAKAPQASLGLSGLTVFLLLLIVMNASPLIPFERAVADRANRLLRPWVVWSAIYALAKTAQAMHSNHPLSDEFSSSMLLCGPALHLWFLPFSFFALVALSGLERRVSLQTRGFFGFSLVLCLFALPVSDSLANATLGHPLLEWAAAIPPLVIGVALRSAGSSPVRQCIVLSAAILSFAGVFGTSGEAPIGVLIGLVLVLLALNFSIPDTSASRWVAFMSMAIYLMHPIFLSPLARGAMADKPILLTVAATFLSVLVGECIRRTSLSKVAL